MTGPARTGAIVLAGGRSSRFGGSKLEAKLGGRTLLEHVLAIAADVADEVVVAGRAIGPAEPIAGMQTAHWIADPEAFGGPLAGLGAALDDVDAHVFVALAGDMPLVRPEVVRAMRAVLESDESIEGVVLAADGVTQPLPLVARTAPARRAAADALGAGERSLQALLGRLRTRVMPDPEWRTLDPSGETVADVDRVEDLERLRTRSLDPFG